MNIAFLTPEYVIPGRLDGGLANYIHKVAHALIPLNHRVTVFVLSHQDRTWNDDQVKIIEVKRVRSQHLHFSTKPGGLIKNMLPALDQIRSANRIARFVREQHRVEHLDIIQTSSYMAPGYALRKNKQIPMVCRVSSYTPVIRSAFGRQRSLGEYISDWLEIRQVIDADAAFAPSQFCISLYEKLESCKPDLLRTPIDMIKINPDDSLYQKELSGIQYLLFFGTLSKIKGADLLADVIPAILKSHPKIHFVIIGRDDGFSDGSKIIDFILQKNQENASHIHYMPAIPKAQLYSIIAHAYAVLMPSRADNYPNACLESQMLGVPVIGTYNSSLEEMIEDGETGFLCENNNLESLINAILQFMALDKLRYQKMKKANIELINKANQENRLKKLLDYYQKVISEFKGS